MKNLGYLRFSSKHSILIVLSLLLLACSSEKKEQDTLFEIVNPTDSGVDFTNVVTESDSLNILDYLYFYNGGGVSAGDVNNDGLVDLYFSSNQNPNKLYLNKGNLQFEDITESAGVAGSSDWNTGTLMSDLNGDGWLDIYVMAVVGINGFEGHNEFFLNNGDGTFSERSQEYGLDLQCYGTHAAVLDYDLDGDLDVYILNHAVHTQESFGRAKIRNERNQKTGDRLLRNDGDRFTDVSEEAGIFGGVNGYGLGISVADFNKDGYPDMYVGNDFHEDDYFYLNNGDGTFSERLKEYFGHTSRFSMGNDAADINNDGWPDLISLDMLPEDDAVIKASEGDDMYQTLKMRTEQYGYHYQYSRNMLFTSQPGKPYMESALLSGVAATDWSWSALFADYDLDGQKDLFISNGIPKRPNNLDYIKFISNEQIQKQLNDSRLVDQQAIEMMPSGKVPNYFFKGDGKLQFDDVTEIWSEKTPSISGASVLADLDNDGDWDIVTNNINEVATLYENKATENHTLSIKLQYEGKNPNGIGAKLYCYVNGQLSYQEMFPVHGFQATSQAKAIFGLGNQMKADSIIVVWPDGSRQKELSPAADPNGLIRYDAIGTNEIQAISKPALFQKVPGNLGIAYEHKEDSHTDFNYQKLIPYEVSDRGPAFAVGDLNNDGMDDLFMGGAQGYKSAIYVQDSKGFTKTHLPEIENDSLKEDVAAYIVQTKDGTEIHIASGGNVVSPTPQLLKNPTYKLSPDGISKRYATEEMLNTDVVVAYDGTVFYGNHSYPLDFGKLPNSYVQFPDGPQQVLTDLGMVTAALWDDFDQNGDQDLIVIGEWMQPRFFANSGNSLKEVNLLNQPMNGLWQSIEAFDMDADGDTDYLLGNWGLNSKFSASDGHPMRMYYADFDDNGTTETVIAVHKNDAYYPLLGLDDLSSQMVFLRKRFTNYKDFAGKTIDEIMGESIKKAKILEVHSLASGVLRNENGSFSFEAFPTAMQLAPIMDFETYDFDGDGQPEVLAGGNYFGVIPFHGRFDSFPGALLESDGQMHIGSSLGLDLTQKSIRHIKVIEINHTPYLLILYNNEKAEVYEIRQ